MGECELTISQNGDRELRPVFQRGRNIELFDIDAFGA